MKLGKAQKAVAVAVVMMFGGRASALDISGLVLTTATTVAGVVAVVMLLTKKKEEPKEGEATDTSKAASASRLYLEQHGVQLAEDVSAGEGPAIDELADALKVRPENRPALGAALQRNAAELLELGDPAKLSDARALSFVQRTLEIAQAEPALSADLRWMDEQA